MPTGIVLGGGGILGGFQVGALKYLHERGCLDDIACICGTSVGAINGAIIATDDKCWPVRLEHFWMDNVLTTGDLLGQQEWFSEFYSLLNETLVDTSRSRVHTLYDFIRDGVRVSRGHLFGPDSGGWSSLEELIKSVATKNSLYGTDVLKKRLDEIDFKPAIDSKIALRFYTTDLETGNLTCFANEEGMKNQRSNIRLTLPEKLVTAVLASAALPGVFPPIRMEGKYYVDGSLREVLPIKGTNDYDPLKKYIILCMPRIREKIKCRHMHGSAQLCPDITDEKHIDWRKSHLLDVAIRSAEILLDEIVDSDMRESGLDPDMGKTYLLAHEGENELAGDMKETHPDAEKEGNRPDANTKSVHPSNKTTTVVKPRGIKPIIIDPLVAVHGLADLHIGLIKINMDQGYMRAFDEVAARSQAKYEECCQLTRLITLQRVAIWKAEHELIERLSEVKHRSSLRKLLPSLALYPVDQAKCLLRAPVDTRILYDIREKKKILKECVMKRKAIVGEDALPAHYKDMWQKWEPHNWDIEGREKDPFIETPWEPLDLGCRGIEAIPSALCPNDH